MAIISGQTIFPLNIRGSLADGGYTASFQIVDASGLIGQDQEIIIYIDDKYGPYWTGSQQVFRGYVPSGQLVIDPVSGKYDVTAHTADYMLRRLFLPGTAFRQGNDENTKTPSQLTLAYVIDNTLTRMTNAAQYIAWDLEQSDVQIAEYSLDEGDPWSWYEEIASYEQRLLYFNRANLMLYRTHPMFRAVPPTAIFDFNIHTMTNINIEKLDPFKVAQVYLLGFKYYDTFTTLFPQLPVESGGRLLEKKGIPVNNQAQLDEIARKLFVFSNSKFKVTVTDARNHHLELLDIVTITYSNPDEDIDWQAKRFYVEACDFTFNDVNGSPSLDAVYDLVEIPDELYFNAA